MYYFKGLVGWVFIVIECEILLLFICIVYGCRLLCVMVVMVVLEWLVNVYSDCVVLFVMLLVKEKLLVLNISSMLLFLFEVVIRLLRIGWW